MALSSDSDGFAAEEDEDDEDDEEADVDEGTGAVVDAEWLAACDVAEAEVV